jgi:hypothetical protein
MGRSGDDIESTSKCTKEGMKKEENESVDYLVPIGCSLWFIFQPVVAVALWAKLQRGLAANPIPWYEYQHQY